MRRAALGGSKGEYAIGRQQDVNQEKRPMRSPERAEHGSTRLPQPDAKSDPPDRADDEDGREDPAKRQNSGQQEGADRDVADGYGAEDPRRHVFHVGA